MKLCLSWCMILPKLTKQCEELLFFIYGKGGGEQVGNVAAAQSEQGFLHTSIDSD